MTDIVSQLWLPDSEPSLETPYAIHGGDCLAFIESLPEEPLFDLVVTSPPYNIGKSYEKRQALDSWAQWQGQIIDAIVRRMKPSGSICWQVGNYVDKGAIIPLDIVLHPLFHDLNLKMRNRIVWHYGHGLHAKNRFSGRYEVVSWYTLTDKYWFNLDRSAFRQNTRASVTSRVRARVSCRATLWGRTPRTSGRSPM